MTKHGNGRTQNESRKRGGQRGNKSACKRPTWPNFELNSPGDVLRFLREVVRATWEGKLGTRQAGAINGSLRLMLEYDSDIGKLEELEELAEKLEEDQKQMQKELDGFISIDELSRILRACPLEVQDCVIEAAKKLRGMKLEEQGIGA